MALDTEPYDIADYLDSDEMIEAFLDESLATADVRIVAQSLAAVARARGGMTQLAQKIGISESDLTASLDTAEPDSAFLLRVAHALGLKLTFARRTPAKAPVAA